MISLKKNKSLKMHIPQFSCDKNVVGEHLMDYDMLSYLNYFSLDFIVGKPGSGKTSLLISMLKGRKKGVDKIYRKCFDKILLVMPSSSINSMKENIFKKLPEDQHFEELNYTNINDIHKRLLISSDANEKTLLILDDVGASLKDSEIQNVFKKIIFNRRHLKCKIIILLQSFISVPRELRKLVSNLFIYKPSKVEFEILFSELFDSKKELADKIMRFVFNEPHVYLMMNIESQRMFKGFDEIIFKNDEDSEIVEKK